MEGVLCYATIAVSCSPLVDVMFGKRTRAVKKAEQNNKEPAFERVDYVLSSRQDVLLH